MDALHVVLGIVALAGVAGAVWLLLQRGALAARVGVAEAEARAGESRAAASEQALAQAQEALRVATARADGALQEAARLTERVAGLAEARESDQRDAARALTEAVEAERKLHRQQLEGASRVHEEKLATVNQAKEEIAARLREFDQKMTATFGNLAAQALKANADAFMTRAEEKLSAKTQEATAEVEKRRLAVENLVRPIAETLTRTDAALREIEKERGAAYAAIMQQMTAVQGQGEALRSETGKLVKALREPQVRGRYGEIQLKRVAELAGMRAYCDFAEQQHTVGDDGRAKRPDMVVKLPNGRELIVDAKANLKPYIDAMEATDPESAEGHLRRFADGVMEQAQKLSKKSYFSDYEGSPEFVVMFVPGEQFVDAALSRRPDLLDAAAGQGVLLASPSSLIAMLRAVSVGFAEQKLSREATEIRSLVSELHTRLATALEHAQRVGTGLGAATKSWNEFVGSVESMLLPQVRRIEESGVQGKKALPEPQVIARQLRTLELGEGVEKPRG